ncbi:O-antigen ligase family protein, partial [Patescibacteria group bacterium]|nr:O-antigen ligase family protein [Patescibacteria group bacterium]MBU4098105.1 O-antigen ligase family protein [Patescibacteria group bacterium]
MKKLLHFYDIYALKIGISLLIIIISLYPKLPSVHIIRTWVYIRLEDFFILAVTLIWLIQVLRRKAKIPFIVSLPIIIYWLIGLVSLIYSLIFIAPSLINFFPHIAILNYLRRIEYMILFFVAVSSVRSLKDIRDYIIIFCLTSLGVVLYGLGQRYWLDLWTKFPHFFEKYSFCFPSFQTGNEEFAKGIPLCLSPGSRLTSTFGGHYDLAAYLVLVIPVLLAVALSIKKLWLRILSSLLFLFNLILLIFTASRVSFIAYLIAVISTLIFYKKKLFIIPVLIISTILLFIFSESTARRFLATARISSVVTNMQGQLIGETTSGLSQELKDKISQNERALEKPPPVERLPEGSGFIGLPQNTAPASTNVAVVKKPLSPEEVRRLKITGGSLEISTISGSFLIRKALVYDISFTTRFQAEWPNAWKAFLRNPLLGSGYSTITLATDNDYFRALGETGILGLVSFLFIFLI